ncbi:MAG TPA: LysM peptidoglycan-binding domain-containing protein [Trueperaceae bacterium]|nr:LysM peptidoglycan-binding domain-containing protein [Trueperaceae bacterium]
MATSVASAQTITVQPGDTLWSIAKRNGTDVATLRELNGLASDQIRPGLVLKLPGGESPAAAARTVTVQAGDTLYDIALAHGVSVSDLIAFNDLDGTLIHPGQVLRLDAGDRELAPLVVEVMPGDSLWSIARSYGTTAQAIADANQITLATVLNPGHKLVVPGQYAAGSRDVGGAVTQTVTVQRGETLWTLAKAHNTTVAAIMSANGLTSERIFAGQQLRIVPGAEIAAGRAVTEVVAPAPTVTGLVWPLVGSITSRYGYRSLRISGSNWHGGIDIDGHTGDPIVAAVGGTVTHAGWQGGYGYLVVVQDGDTEYYYAHASEVLVNVGDVVRAGDTIALVGSTGNSTGSHLHFEVRVNGESVDPLPLLEATAQR